jgi:hypothetical protein
MVRFPASRVTHAPGPLLITSHRKTSSASGSLKWQALGPAIVHQACGLLLRGSTQPSDAYFKSDAYAGGNFHQFERLQIPTDGPAGSFPVQIDPFERTGEDARTISAQLLIEALLQSCNASNQTPGDRSDFSSNIDRAASDGLAHDFA